MWLVGFVMLEIKPRASHKHNKHSANFFIPHACVVQLQPSFSLHFLPLRPGYFYSKLLHIVQNNGFQTMPSDRDSILQAAFVSIWKMEDDGTWVSK